MKSKHEIPNKHDYMKTHSFNFIENEKINSDLLHEQNVGKIKSEFYKFGQGEPGQPSASKSHSSLVTQSGKMEEDSSRVHKLAEKAETCIVTKSRMDYSGSAPKRYITKCYIEPVTVPIWYTESMFLNIGSTRRKFEEKIYFKNKLMPHSWSESMHTEIKTVPRRLLSEVHIPVEKSEIHYIPIEPQQIAVGAN